MGAPTSPDRRAAAAWPLPLGVVAVLLVLRSAQLGCMETQLYLGEYAQLGQLAWDLQHGDFVWADAAQFARDYRWFHFAQGTLLIQVLTAAFATFLPPTLAMHAPSMLAEAASVAVVVLVAGRVLPPRRALLVAAALVLVPAAAVAWHLLPFGNHSEFLVVPALLVLLVGEKRTWWRWGLASVVLGLGLALYQAHALTAAAFLGACVLDRERRWGAVSVVVGGAALAWTALTLLSMPAEGVSEMARYLRDMQPMIEGSPLDALTNHAIFGAPQSSWWLALPYRLVLLTFGVAAWRSGTFAGRFPALLALVGTVVPLVVAAGAQRYFLLGFFALLLALPAALRASPRLAPLLGVLILGGAVDNARFLQLGGASASSQVDPLAFGPGMGIWWLDADEVPYWRRLFDEGRANPWVGHASYHRTGAHCASHAFGFPALAGGVPPWDRERCHGFAPGELAWTIDSVLGEGAIDGWEEPALLDALGRGAWIVSQRDLTMLEEALQGAAPHRVEAVMAGARDEASRQQQKPVE
ncbi:MAG: hypothetical protein KDA24_10850 [Deltaproteobacteria bacterium]|nr:hypothetical protein [Deltaproteobacteria bacterium]